MMRKPMIAANWKMNSAPLGWDTEDSPYKPQDGIDVIVFPTYLDIRSCLEKFLEVGAQFGRPEESGPHTGDVSMNLLANHGCRYVLCGHSERRKSDVEKDPLIKKQMDAAIQAGLLPVLCVGEEASDAFIALQVESAIKAGLHPILCVGETAEERKEGKAKDVVKRQLYPATDGNYPITIAYEPRWAIGKGVSATPEDAADMHAFIRSLLPEEHRDTIRILYGGSVKPDNAKEILAQPNVDGALIGGASLDPQTFRAIIDCLPSSSSPISDF